LFFDRRAHVLVEAVGADVELAVVEPLVEGRVAGVEHAREGLGPDHVLAGQVAPEALEVLVGLGAHGLIGGHARDVGVLHHAVRRWKYAVLDQDRVN